MAIGPVVSRGYGTFGTVNLVVTRGYTAAAVTVPTKAGPYWVAPPADVGYVAPEARLEFVAPDLPGES